MAMDKLQLPNPAGKDKWQELISLHPSDLPPTLFDIGVVDGLVAPDEKAVGMATLHDAKYAGTNPRTTFLLPVSHMKILPLHTCAYLRYAKIGTCTVGRYATMLAYSYRHCRGEDN